MPIWKNTMIQLPAVYKDNQLPKAEVLNLWPKNPYYLAHKAPYRSRNMVAGEQRQY